jgi:hypothetical protein
MKLTIALLCARFRTYGIWSCPLPRFRLGHHLVGEDSPRERQLREPPAEALLQLATEAEFQDG